jgi:hypothetical protein
MPKPDLRPFYDWQNEYIAKGMLLGYRYGTLSHTFYYSNDPTGGHIDADTLEPVTMKELNHRIEYGYSFEVYKNVKANG